MHGRFSTAALRSLRTRNAFLGAYPAIPFRSFSSTAAYGLRATFVKTENPDLDPLLDQIQEKIILPAYLPEKQREMVFDTRNTNLLAQNPIVLELDDMEYKFSPLDRTKDIPNSKKVLNEAMAMMKTREEWQNFIILLAGYKKAGIKLSRTHFGKATRLAGKTNQIYTILECAKQVDQTGFHLSKECTLRALCFINDKIIDSNGAKANTTQAAKWCDILLDLIQRPEHQGEGVHKAYFSKYVRGMTLFNRVCGYKVGALDKTAVVDEVAAFRSLWGEAELQETSQSEESIGGLPMKPSFVALRILGQNVKAIRLARDLGIEGAEGLSDVEDALGALSERALELGRRNNRAWDVAYREVIDVSLEGSDTTESDAAAVEA